MNPEIILASASPRRSELLKELGVAFEVIPSRADELHDDSISPIRLCEWNAERKAAEVASRFPDRVVIGADTLVALGRSTFGKPRNLSEARLMLTALSGRTHQVVTGVALIHRASGREELFSDVTDVQFRRLTPTAVDAYLSLVHVLDKAGGYAIQEHGDQIVETTFGSRSNVVGLPLEKLEIALKRWGVLLAAKRPNEQLTSRG